MFSKLNKSHYLIIASVAIISYLAILPFVKSSYFVSQSFPDGVRLVTDDYDRLVHFDRAGWYINHQIPYAEVFSEYPQFITYLFAVPALMTTNPNIYILIYSALMAITFLVLVYFTLDLLDYYNKPKYYVLLLLLPSFLYHTINRFDILPSLSVVLALWWALRQKYFWSINSLLVGFFIKWFPILLMPIVLFQVLKKDRKTFFIYGSYAVLFILIVFGLSYGWSGKAIFDPYRWHLEKGYYFESIYYLIGFLPDYIVNALNIHLVSLGLQVISLLVPFVVFLHSYTLSKKQILDSFLYVILIFIFFSAGRAPQFNLWFVPLFILAIRDRKGIALLIVFDLINYLFYPIGFATAHTNYSHVNDTLAVLKNALYILIFAYLILTKTDKK